MKYYLIISILFLLIFTGCENEEIISPDISYDELLVVQSELNADLFFPGVRVTKTLPLGTTFNIKSAEIKNAILYLRVNGIKIIPLHYTTDGLYKPLYEFRVREGEIYELFGERDSQTFYAKTIIPFKPEVFSTSFNSGSQFAEANIKSLNGEVYAALWVVDVGSFKMADNFYNISVPENISVVSTINVRSAPYPAEYQNIYYNGRRYIQVFSFDSAFNNYFKTKIQSETINNPYVQGSGTTVWNLQGSKVIGMFIGVTKGDIVKVN
jgi:hypothetical protein